MAPKRLLRRPARAPEPSWKRASSEDASVATKRKLPSVDSKCAEVAAALEEYGKGSYPTDVLQMLVAGISTSLAVVKEERHQFQQKIVDWIQAVFDTSAAASQKEIDDVSEKLKCADAQKVEREASVKERQQRIVELKLETATLQSAFNEASFVEKEASARLDAANKAQAGGETECDAAASKK